MIELPTTSRAAHPSRMATNRAHVMPEWASALIGCATTKSIARERMELTTTAGERGTIVTAIARAARVNDGDGFHHRALDIYRVIRRELDASPHRSIVRMWNHIPGIHDPLDDRSHERCDRYMHFNAARFEAMCEWFGGAENIAAYVPAASGVGDDGNDLIVHALALASPGTPMENPRQIPAFKYSKRFGPLPPCFARATRVEIDHRSLLIIAGTAAITGEQSRHDGDLSRQLEMTLENLRVLIRAASPGRDEAADPLRRMSAVRAYVKNASDAVAIEELTRGVLGSDDIQIVRADLCRAELLVEIEGIAELRTAHE